MNKILIAGSRTITDYQKFVNFIWKEISSEDIIISGGAKDIDTFAYNFARDNAIQINIFFPSWSEHGIKAGILRNEIMVKECDKALIIWDGISRGTQSTINFLEKYNKPYKLFMIQN